MLSSYYIKRLAAKASAVKESLAAAVSNCAAYSNAPASKREQAGNKHAASMRNIHLGKHSLAKHAVLRVVVQA